MDAELVALAGKVILESDSFDKRSEWVHEFPNRNSFFGISSLELISKLIHVTWAPATWARATWASLSTNETSTADATHLVSRDRSSTVPRVAVHEARFPLDLDDGGARVA